MNKKLEYTALRSVDRVIVNSRRKKESLLQSFPLLHYNEVLIIPDGYDPSDFENNDAKIESSSKMKLTYAGILNEYFTAEYFLKAFKKLSNERPDIAVGIELEFIGILSKENKKLIKELGITEFVRDHGYLEHGEVIKKIKVSDVLWLMVDKIVNSDTITNEKLSDYFGSKKPILGCLPEGPEKLSLSEYGASFLTKQNDIKEIYDAFIRIYGLYTQKQLPEPNQEFINKHNVISLTEQLTTAFQFYLRAE
jgi:glycosyltransferase involved in cell wall biosynthesis